MPNAYVLIHHFGDEGNVSEGMILRDLPSKRFNELEGRGLVREATAAELKAGYRPPFDREGDSGGQLTAIQQVEALRAELAAATRRADEAEAARDQANERASAVEADLRDQQAQLADALAANEALTGDLDTTRTDLDAARGAIDELTAAAAKAAEDPANKQAADPANKAGGKSADKAS